MSYQNCSKNIGKCYEIWWLWASLIPVDWYKFEVRLSNHVHDILGKSNLSWNQWFHLGMQLGEGSFPCSLHCSCCSGLDLQVWFHCYDVYVLFSQHRCCSRKCFQSMNFHFTRAARVFWKPLMNTLWSVGRVCHQSFVSWALSCNFRAENSQKWKFMIWDGRCDE